MLTHRSHRPAAALGAALFALAVLTTGCSSDHDGPKTAARAQEDGDLTSTSAAFEEGINRHLKRSRAVPLTAASGSARIENVPVHEPVALAWYRPFQDSRLTESGKAPAKGYSYCVSTRHRYRTVTSDSMLSNIRIGRSPCPAPATVPEG